MALHYCTGCTTAYALGLDVCPHCRQPTNVTVTELAPLAAPGEPMPGRRRARREPPAGETEAAGTDA